MLIFQHETTGQNCGTSVAFAEILDKVYPLFNLVFPVSPFFILPR